MKAGRLVRSRKAGAPGRRGSGCLLFAEKNFEKPGNKAGYSGVI